MAKGQRIIRAGTAITTRYLINAASWSTSDDELVKQVLETVATADWSPAKRAEVERYVREHRRALREGRHAASSQDVQESRSRPFGARKRGLDFGDAPNACPATPSFGRLMLAAGVGVLVANVVATLIMAAVGGVLLARQNGRQA